jgi:hypothetical protein
MIRTLLLGLAVVIAADNASAQGRSVYGLSSTSCGQWLQARTAKNRSSLQLQAYVDGFLSGYNFAAVDPDFLASMPHDKGESFHTWIDDYCRGKPDNDLTEAVVALKDELLARAR